ncbi:MAG TPA: type II toxin-antitoxin system RelE/ParE family toxin [Bryobacteraceae bacterium]|nr:type II toxin-antitoxin system RelE/ParE family toxin [Bryobacteraceae bacterium]
MKPVVLRPAAERDIQEIHDWYETRRQGLGDEFLEEVEPTLTLIELYPQAFPALRARIRRAVILRFPYNVFFRETDQEIHVIALLHGGVTHASGVSRI